ncbi:MAG: DMT family transporter [Paracoccaceae bacterium]|nr:DMT family transporter [Paracoccaceae bacterium]
MSFPGSGDARPGLAALWMAGAIVAFSSMAVAGRAAASELDTFEIMMYRSFIGIALVVSLGAALGRLRDIAPRRLGLHGLRNLSHFAGQNLWFYALTLIPLAQLFALEFTSPIWVMILAALILGERLTRVRLAAVGLGFAGALIVAQPGAGGDAVGLLAAAASAIGFAGSIVITKLLTRTETTVSILFWLTVMQAGMGVIAAGIDGDITWPSPALWPWLALIGAAGLFAHLCLTTALTLAPATVVVPMDFLRLPAIALLGAVFYDEPLSAPVFLGGALIFAANYLNIATARAKAADL